MVLPPPFGPRTHITSPPPSENARSRPTVRPGKPKASLRRLEHHQLRARTAAKQPQEERRADERGQHAGRQLDDRDACGIACPPPSMKPAPSSMASGSSRPKSGPTSKRAACGISRPDPADDAADGDHRSGHQCRRTPPPARRRRRVHAERAGLVVGERQADSCASAGAASATSRRVRAAPRRRGRCGAMDARLPSSQKVIAGQLVVRVGEVLQQRNRRAEQGADHHAGEHEREQRIVAAHARADAVDQTDGNQAASEGEELDAEDPRAIGRSRAPRPARRRSRPRGYRATPAGCGTFPGRRCRRRRAPRRRAAPPARGGRVSAERRSLRFAETASPVISANNSAIETG